MDTRRHIQLLADFSGHFIDRHIVEHTLGVGDIAGPLGIVGGLFGRRRAELDLRLGGLAVAHIGDRHFLARGEARDHLLQLAVVFDLGLLDARHHIAALDPAFVGGTAGAHFTDERALLHVKRRDQVRLEGLGLNPEERPLNAAVFHQLLCHETREIHRNHETQPGVPIVALSPGRVYSDEASIGVEQRTAGIARIDRRVGLQKILRAIVRSVATEGAQNSATHGESTAGGITQREHHVAEFQLVAVAQRRGREAGRSNLQHGDIRAQITPHHRRGVFLARIAERDLHVLRTLDNVTVSDNIAIGRNHHT